MEETHMNRVEDIEQQVRNLSSEEFQSFREWFAAYDAETWDRQFETDVHSGKLNRFADQALRDHSAGRSTRL